MKQVDVLIVGQGIAGTFLSFELMEAGFSVMVIDNQQGGSASRVASGVINPVTGRRVVETWKIGALLPLALDSYNRIALRLQMPPVARAVEILSVHGSEQMRDAFNKRMEAGSAYIREINVDKPGRFFNHPYGASVITPALLIDIKGLLDRYRLYLQSKQCLMACQMDWSALQLDQDRLQQYGAVSYPYGAAPEEKIQAKWIIAADGWQAGSNPYFKQLAFRYNKGEALIVDIAGLSREYIYKLRYSVVPWEGDTMTASKNLFWVGSTYQWTFEHDQPSDAFKENVLEFLDKELLLPYSVEDHLAAVRPASINRRPFAGFHEDYPQLGVLNGLGTKGCSLAPYLALGWRDLLTLGKDFDPELSLDADRH
ncbi:Glycine/D-amino acid oxidase [Arachidicoccus rhizosphaerae]|uniref:Glycine/D-amino acid oxidase n=1 Tax=Arachidicoccus rhizosphaerae TaxID=551991 RepID=A0A1H3YJ00_9BACT|nr:FAD-binding oxidoreductase [Arachidicoccus rhizosphaerae]SEA11599.1 Glycine/D-amino acid oxidase [Arachidicoccus rhizosphaerae]